MKPHYSEIPNDYKLAIEKFIGAGNTEYVLTEDRFNSLYDMEFGLAMFNAGKEHKVYLF